MENILPDCTTLIAALDTVASYVSDRNALADLTGQTAVLTNLEDHVPALVQLSSGGNAILSVPSGTLINGRQFRIILSGLVHTSHASTNLAMGLGVGDSFPPLGVLVTQSSTGTTDSSFYSEILCFWDSGSSQLRSSSLGSMSINPSLLLIPSSANLQFVIYGENIPGFANPVADLTDYITITQFRLELV